ncbi:NAD(P)/FAD-dependent oxidoreductase [Nocardioides sp.]|uniref:NAD(P)/FAD-dependent oxidoreductase n=1 Tax=Nocardioides sp. TaxID=35761 RepID=UPI0035658266
MTNLLLVGAGHTHLHLVRRAAELLAVGYRVRLLAPRYFHYSGLASATAAGTVPTEAGRIDVAALARRAGIAHHDGTLVGLDRARRVATTAAGSELAYDVLSFNIGSVVAEHAMTVDPSVLRVKPLSSLNALDERLRRASAANPGGSGPRVTVVGGGATGIELATHLAVRDGVESVRLLEASDRVGADLPVGARRRLERLLAERGVDVRTGWCVDALGPRSARSTDGSEVAHDAAILATGLAAPPIVSELGLGDADGVPVRDTLQHVEHDEIHAVGDCAHFLSRPLPRIGVHGVRQGPVLLASLLARADGTPLPTYEPQTRALSILDLGGGQALATWGRFWWQGRSALRLKRRIDNAWLSSYRSD